LPLLESAGLEPPAIVKLFIELRSMGIVREVPTTIKDGQKQLAELTKRKKNE